MEKLTFSRPASTQPKVHKVLGVIFWFLASKGEYRGHVLLIGTGTAEENIHGSG